MARRCSDDATQGRSPRGERRGNRRCGAVRGSDGPARPALPADRRRGSACGRGKNAGRRRVPGTVAHREQGRYRPDPGQGGGVPQVLPGLRRRRAPDRPRGAAAGQHRPGRRYRDPGRGTRPVAGGTGHQPVGPCARVVQPGAGPPGGAGRVLGAGHRRRNGRAERRCAAEARRYPVHAAGEELHRRRHLVGEPLPGLPGGHAEPDLLPSVRRRLRQALPVLSATGEREVPELGGRHIRRARRHPVRHRGQVDGLGSRTPRSGWSPPSSPTVPAAGGPTR